MDHQVQRRIWRRDLLARRESLPVDFHAEASRRILDHLWKAWPVPPEEVVSCYFPIRNEVDVWPLVDRWQCVRSVRVVMPAVMARDQPLVFREWRKGEPLSLDRYGIPYPVAGEPRVPGFLLLPVNGFDAQGYRLGYGGGYFDRTLANRVPRPLTVGVGFEFQRLPTTLPGEQDIPLDIVVTEAGLFRSPARVDIIDRS
ncbi:5-formyltetrahydrofolate cyclo-ligase [Gammaproteobacteria bacterium]